MRCIGIPVILIMNESHSESMELRVLVTYRSSICTCNLSSRKRMYRTAFSIQSLRLRNFLPRKLALLDHGETLSGWIYLHRMLPGV